MNDQSGIELATWIAYEQLDEERRTAMIARAIALAFNAGKKPQASEISDDEEVIDTTSPEFREHFKGFINTPTQRRSSQRTFGN